MYWRIHPNELPVPLSDLYATHNASLAISAELADLNHSLEYDSCFGHVRQGIQILEHTTYRL